MIDLQPKILYFWKKNSDKKIFPQVKFSRVRNSLSLVKKFPNNIAEKNSLDADEVD